MIINFPFSSIKFPNNLNKNQDEITSDYLIYEKKIQSNNLIQLQIIFRTDKVHIRQNTWTRMNPQSSNRLSANPALPLEH